MALPKSRNDREYKKFVEDADGDVAINVKLKDATISGDVEIDVTAFKDEDGVQQDALVKSTDKVLYSRIGSEDDTTDTSQFIKIDGGGHILSKITDGTNEVGITDEALDVNIKSGVTLEVNLDATSDDVLVYGFDGSANQKIKTTSGGELEVVFPSTQEVSVTNFPSTQNVEVSNFPSTQDVNVTNAVGVTGDFYPTTQNVSIVDASVAVTGTFYPTTQEVTVNNFPSTQNVEVLNILQNKTYTHSVETVGTTSATILALEADRTGAVFQNDSTDTIIYLSFNGDAELNKGIRLGIGGSYEISQELGNNTTSLINAICGGSADVLITEMINA